MNFLKLCSSILVISSLALAEDGRGLPSAKIEGAVNAKTSAPAKSGRLADGRAYRVDSDGFQIVDHIAELEATVDSLNRQVNSLENQIEDHEVSVGSEFDIDEEDLGQSFATSKDPQPRNVITPAAHPKAPRDCSLEISSMRRKIAILEKGLVRSRRVALKGLAQNNEVEELRDQVARLQKALMSAPSEDRVSREISSLESGISKREQLLNAQRQRVQQLQSTLQQRADSAEEKLEEVADLLAKKDSTERSLRSEVERLSSEVASLKSSAKHTRVAAGKVSRGSLRRSSISKPDGFDQRSVRAASSEFKRKLFKVEALVLERDRVFRIAKSGGPINVSKSKLETQTGDSLSDIRSDVLGLNSGSNITAIRSGIAQLERVLLRDIDRARGASRRR